MVMKDSIIDKLRNSRIRDDTILDKLIIDLYKSCLKIIEMKNNNSITSMIYEVPYLFIGYPVYSTDIVCVKLNIYLKKKGFKSLYKPPNKIYISW